MIRLENINDIDLVELLCNKAIQKIFLMIQIAN